MALLVPVIDAATVSVAVMVWLPAVSRVADKVPTPLVRVELAGRTAAPSVDVKWTAPAYPVAVALVAVRAVTVKPKALPAVADGGAETEKWVAGAVTVTGGVTPHRVGLATSVTSTVCD